MLTSTFLHLSGIGASTERRLWEQDILSWDAFLQRPHIAGLSAARKALHDASLSTAVGELQRGNARYFAGCLPAREQWRLFRTFQSRALYLDIETTGLPAPFGEVTVVGLYRAGEVRTLLRGEALTRAALQDELDRADLLITFFGRVFDVPFLQAKFPGLRLSIPHLDLCFAAKRVGLQGGLKHLERELQIERESDLQSLDGADAVLLWQRAQAGDDDALDRLIRYNAADTRNLEPLAEQLYDRLAAHFGPHSLGA